MTIYNLDVLLSNFEPVPCSMSISNCCFLTCIQLSQEAGKVVWYSSLFKKFPQVHCDPHNKSFSVVNEVAYTLVPSIVIGSLHSVFTWLLIRSVNLDHSVCFILRPQKGHCYRFQPYNYTPMVYAPHSLPNVKVMYFLIMTKIKGSIQMVVASSHM